MTRILNTNNLAVYGAHSDTLAVIRELKKLGLFKSSKPKSKAKPKMIDDVKQESDMVASTTQFPLRVIDSTMTQQQITDAQRKNEVAFAALRGEVQQQRLEDIERQQGQRFEDVMRFGQILNPVLERFRGSQEPARADPFERSSTILLGDTAAEQEPDVEEREFTQTINKGGPSFQREPITEIFQKQEKEQGGLPLRPQAKISAKPTRNQFLQANGLAHLPPNTKNTTLQEMRTYYDDFNQAFGLDSNDSVLQNRADMYKDMTQKLDDLINLSI